MSLVYQFNIGLKNSRPRIWRRIQVPQTYYFQDLHVAIQCAMGWGGGHLNNFSVSNLLGERHARRIIGVAREAIDYLFDTEVMIFSVFQKKKDKAYYIYDFGDKWEHEIVLEDIVTAAPNTTYPKCLAGRMACPPENCGGIGGYKRLLEIIANPNHKEYQEQTNWLEEKGYENFDPKKFDPKSVIFSSDFMF